MLNSVKAAIKRYNMFKVNKTVTVALSGGADSVALLYALLDLRDELGLNITAAHLNHCLRGKESDGDEQYVRDLCSKLGVELFVERADVKNVALKNKQSIELAARNVRYEFLKKVSPGLIATAHTADDNLETVIYNITRGTGLFGLAGIPPVRDNIIRPLIFATRQEVEAFCDEKGVQFMTDSTNNDDIYARNKIRHNVVPVLKGINEGAAQNVSNMCELLREDAEYLESVADKEFRCLFDGKGLFIDGLLKLPTTIRKRVIIKLYKMQVGVCPESNHIELIVDMLKLGKPRQSVLNDYFAVNKNGCLLFETKGETHEPFCYKIGNKLPFCAEGVKIYTKTAEDLKKISRINNLLLKNAVDCDKLSGEVILRSRLIGDSIKLQGRNVTKSLKKLFSECKIDQSVRDSLPVAADEKGVFWVSGFGADQRVKPDENTKTVLVFDVAGTED